MRGTVDSPGQAHDYRCAFGPLTHPTTVIPELRLGIGGTDLTLAKVNLFSPPVGYDSSFGLLGVDVFANAREVTIDFQAMRLVVR